MFLKLEGRRCLVVGAGTHRRRKNRRVDRDRCVRFASSRPKLPAQVQTWAGEGKIDWERREFLTSDLQGMFLVVAATSSTPLHEEIFAEAQKLGVLCNIVDVPHLCDFFYPAIVRRGSLQIAISTAGESPALSQRLRKELEQQFGPEYEAWVAAIGEARAELATRDLSAEDRKGNPARTRKPRILRKISRRVLREGQQKQKNGEEN